MDSMADYRCIRAYHEAGHAAALHFLGLPFRYVSIRLGKKSGGRVKLIGRVTRENRHGMIVAILASDPAEGRYYREHPEVRDYAPEEHSTAVSLDFAKADRLCQKGETISLYRGETKDFVEKHWATVEAIAKALLVKKGKILTADEVGVIVCSVEKTEAD